MELNFIRIPLYILNYVETIEEIELDKKFLEQFRSEYDTEERENIFKQLEWAVKNPDYDYRSLAFTDSFENEEIYKYIKNLHNFLKENKATA